MNYISCMKLIGIKSGKRNKSGQNFGGCTSTGHQRPTCTGTSPTCTGTCQQNATYIGTGPGCTLVPVHVSPKCPKCCVFV